jgi:S1-C subfamily serine protease
MENEMRRHLVAYMLVIMAALLTAPAHAANGKEDRLRKAMVKIFTVSAAPNYYAPWRMLDPNQVTGSGCVISGNRIITNAHVVSNAKFIQVQPYGDPDRYNARVKHIAHEVDLAILEVEDKGMFKGISPLKFGKLPDTLDEVLVYGFPTGGTTLSITKGVLSRIEYQTYSHSNSLFLSGQIDAAINPGNSGGPVIKGGRIVGITMQKNIQRGVENIGYMIPTPVIKHVLKDISDSRYDGFPLVGFSYQDLESPALRAKYMMGEGQTGVLVTHVNWNSAARDILREGDVLLSVDGHELANDGTVEFRKSERTDFIYYVHAHQLGEDMKLRVLREGKERDIKVRLAVTAGDAKLVDSYAYDTEPDFFVYGGFLFMPITENYLCTWKNCSAPEQISIYVSRRPTEDKRDMVVMVRALPDETNKGYHSLNNFVVDKVNGLEYVDFEDFYNKVMGLPGEFVTFTDSVKRQVVINRSDAAEARERIMNDYRITRDSSEGLTN